MPPGSAPGMAALPHTTDTSSLCRQLVAPQGAWRHSCRLVSLPLHTTESSQMGPEPGPNMALPTARPGVGRPISRQATLAAASLKSSSQTCSQNMHAQVERG